MLSTFYIVLGSRFVEDDAFERVHLLGGLLSEASTFNGRESKSHIPKLLASLKQPRPAGLSQRGRLDEGYRVCERACADSDGIRGTGQGRCRIAWRCSWRRRLGVRMGIR